jgi:branched-chain amino acid transport system ATP-binding protein
VTRSFRLSRHARGLTVVENLRLAVGGFAAACDCGSHAAGERELVDRALDQLERLALVSDARKQVFDLPPSRQRLVEIAVALAQHPKLLLLDEPADGVPSSEIRAILDVVSGLDRDMTVLVIEHNMDVVFQVADRIIVLVSGAVLMEGTREEFAARQQKADRVFSGLSLDTLSAMHRIVGSHPVASSGPTASGATPAALA